MIRISKSTQIAAALFFLALAPIAFAQDHFKVTLPVAARIGTTVVPAGDYSFRVINNGSDLPVLSVYSDAGVHILAPAIRTHQAENSSTNSIEVVLSNSAAGYRVSKILFPGKTSGYELF